jgi:ribosomal protein S18 acetylase RimI-like enzyme
VSPCVLYDAPVTVHPLDRAHAVDAVDAVFAALSPQSRFLRFHSPIPHLPPTLREQLVDLDGTRRAAVVAEVPGADGPVPVGIARISARAPGSTAEPPSGTADIAVAVADAWHCCGIGTQLLRAAAELAGEIGYTRIQGSVLVGNVAVLELVRSTFPGFRRWFDGYTVQVVVAVGPEATITDEDVLAELLSR